MTTNPKLSGVFDDIFKQVDKYLPLAVGSFSAFQKPKIQGQAKGLPAIQAAGQQVIQALQQIASIRPITTESLQQANALASTLGNEQYFYQPKKGKDKEALDNFKAQARDIISQMQLPVITVSNSGNLQTIDTPNNLTSQIGKGVSWIEEHPVTGGAIAGLFLYLFFRKQ